MKISVLFVLMNVDYAMGGSMEKGHLEMIPADSNLTILYGASGAGKTRKLKEIERQGDHEHTLLVGTEVLVGDVIDSLRSEGNSTPRSRRYREVDTLLVDNLWVLASRPRLANYFRNLIAARLAHRRNTILASDMTLAQWSEYSSDMVELLSEAVPVQM